MSVKIKKGSLKVNDNGEFKDIGVFVGDTRENIEAINEAGNAKLNEINEASAAATDIIATDRSQVTDSTKILINATTDNVVVLPTIEEHNKLADDISAINDDLRDLRAEVEGGGSGGGVSKAMADSLYALLEKCAFVSDDVTAEVSAFKSVWNIGGDTPEPVPPTPEKTLQSISVEWESDSADVGTDPSTLIDSVIAHYSDGSTEVVTGYSVTPSALVEGAQMVTVTYNGKTATNEVTGVSTPSVSEVLTIKRATSTAPSASDGYSITFTENTGYKNAGTEWSENEGSDIYFGAVDGNKVQCVVMLEKADGTRSFSQTNNNGVESLSINGEITLKATELIYYSVIDASGIIHLPYKAKVRLYFRNATDITGIISGLHVELRG